MSGAPEAGNQGGMDVAALVERLRRIQTTRSVTHVRYPSDESEYWRECISDHARDLSAWTVRWPDGSEAETRLFGDTRFRRLTQEQASQWGKDWFGDRSPGFRANGNCCGAPLDFRVMAAVVQHPAHGVEQIEGGLTRLGYAFARRGLRGATGVPEALRTYFRSHQTRHVLYAFDVATPADLQRVTVRTLHQVSCADWHITDQTHTFLEFNRPVDIVRPPDEAVRWAKRRRWPGQ